MASTVLKPAAAYGRTCLLCPARSCNSRLTEDPAPPPLQTSPSGDAIVQSAQGPAAEAGIQPGGRQAAARHRAQEGRRHGLRAGSIWQQLFVFDRRRIAHRCVAGFIIVAVNGMGVAGRGEGAVVEVVKRLQVRRPPLHGRIGLCLFACTSKASRSGSSPRPHPTPRPPASSGTRFARWRCPC